MSSKICGGVFGLITMLFLGLSLLRSEVNKQTGPRKASPVIVEDFESYASSQDLAIQWYTTGWGQRWPRRPLHVDFEYSSQPPPPGITVMGNVDQVRSWEETFDKVARSCFTPDRKSWPALETYWEQFWYPPMAEYTVQHPMAATSYAWGFLAARSHDPKTKD